MHHRLKKQWHTKVTVIKNNTDNKKSSEKAKNNSKKRDKL
jgi:hypothetical protein